VTIRRRVQNDYDLQDAADAQGVSLEDAARDLALLSVMASLTDNFGERIIFKGGAALRFAHGARRTSRDADATVTQPARAPIPTEDVLTAIAGARLGQFLRYTVPKEPATANKYSLDVDQIRFACATVEGTLDVVFMWAGWLDAKLVDLPDQQATNPITRQRFEEQWSSMNPRFRAAHAVATYLEHGGIEPLNAGGTLSSEQRELIDEEREYWRPAVEIHFGGKLLQWAMFDFGQGTPRVVVVLNPTARKRTLRALDMRALVDRDKFFNFQYGDERLKLIERMAVADRAGELPDYMREFFDSLRTRALR
jgi:hypothetical protein